MRQRILTVSTRCRNEMFLSRVESQYLVGSASPSGHSISSVSSARPAARLMGAMRTGTRAKRERSRSEAPSRHVIVRQAFLGRVSALDAHALRHRTTIQRCTRFDRRNDAGRIGQPQRADAGAQRGVGPVARIHQYDTTRYTRLAGRADLLKRDLGLGLERDPLAHI